MNHQHVVARQFRRGARLLLVAVSALMLILASGTAAQAATSSYLIRNANNQIMVEAWYNSGTHNMSKGRNSFTVKDHICGDGYSAEVGWRYNNYGVVGTRTVGCGEKSFSIEPNDVPRTQLIWWVCATHTTHGTGWCSFGITDYLD